MKFFKIPLLVCGLGSVVACKTTIDTAKTDGMTTEETAPDRALDGEKAAPAMPEEVRVNPRKTADQQSNQPADLKTTADIRSMITEDPSLSMSAHNITIVTQNGVVTLSGTVEDDAEKAAVGAAAERIAGRDKVRNQTTVFAAH